MNSSPVNIPSRSRNQNIATSFTSSSPKGKSFSCSSRAATVYTDHKQSTSLNDSFVQYHDFHSGSFKAESFGKQKL
ncbi:hypothetical protein HDV02_002740 [Globomyces sp. JEL0801]|nr:hypothetical protein HDV02_002735 [Globomyces sp. JEL0801]KAJ2992956.1 hypothetical protein HDV02_002740 [Globomyces sp. JEL0801]